MGIKYGGSFTLLILLEKYISTVSRCSRDRKEDLYLQENSPFTTNRSCPWGSSAWKLLCIVKCLFFNVKISLSWISVNTTDAMSSDHRSLSLQQLPFLSLIDNSFPLHLHTSRPEVVLTVKSSPVKAKAFSFICRVIASGWHCARIGPRGGLNASSGAILWWGLVTWQLFPLRNSVQLVPDSWQFELSLFGFDFSLLACILAALHRFSIMPIIISHGGMILLLETGRSAEV